VRHSREPGELGEVVTTSVTVGERRGGGAAAATIIDATTALHKEFPPVTNPTNTSRVFD